MALGGGSSHHVTLNSVKYVLIEESYRKRAQQAFSPRFATGDPGYGDLSFWQFLKQDTWDGGAGQIKFSTTNKIQESKGWSFLSGKPRLSGGNQDTGIGSISSLNSAAKFHGGMLKYKGITGGSNFDLVLFGIDSSNVYDSSKAIIRASTVTLAGILRLKSTVAAVWNRQAPSSGAIGDFLVCSQATANSVQILDNDLSVVDSFDPPGSALATQCFVPINQNSLMVIGLRTLGSSNAYKLVAQVTTYDANAWTGASVNGWGGAGAPVLAGSAVSTLLPRAVLDTNSAIYFALNDSNVGAPSSDHNGGIIGIFTAADAILSAGPRFSELVYYPDLIIHQLFSINGTIFFLATEILYPLLSGSTIRYRHVVFQFPRTRIWESPYIQENATGFVNLGKAGFQDNRDEAYFVVPSSGNSYHSIMRLRSGPVVEEIGALAPLSPTEAAAGANGYMALNAMGGVFYAYDVVNNKIIELNNRTGSVGRAPTTTAPSLKLSAMGANTELINKTLYAVIIKLSEAVPSGETLTIYANDTSIGTIVNADGTRKEITLTTEITSSDFTIRIDAAGTAVWIGSVDSVAIKFIPTQFKKRAWAFGIRADRNMKLIDGSRETSTPATIFTNLQTAWSSNIPVTFIDVDGTSYTVLVTDFDMRRPLINTDNNKAESLLFCELLEV